MANKSLFSSLKSLIPRVTARNDAGGPAYALDAKQTLAQLAATGCFNGTYYADAAKQLDTLSCRSTRRRMMQRSIRPTRF